MRNDNEGMEVQDPKYIKWPSKKQVAVQALSVLFGVAALLALTAAGDAAGNLLLQALFG